MLVSWLEGYFDQLHAAGYQSNELALTGVMVNLFAVRSGMHRFLLLHHFESMVKLYSMLILVFRNGNAPPNCYLDVFCLSSLLDYRGGIGATLGAIGAQLPYPYVHLVYWTIQIVLVALSIETGVILAMNTYFKDNGTIFLWCFTAH